MTLRIKIARALLSVSDKTGLVDLAHALARHGAEIVSTGGTATALRDAGVTVTDVSDHTGFPEMMDGRLKTLHPKVHGGLLALRDDDAHQTAAQAHDIEPIDLVAINLYPFEATVAAGKPRADIIENIDIGGPAMVRSAAKNHAFVACVTDTADYAELIQELDAHDGALGQETRERLAAKAFQATAAYDSAIASWFAFADQGEMFPERLPLVVRRVRELRYGENPHQRAALYAASGVASGLAGATLVQGKALSYNNLGDADGALGLIAEFRDAGPTVAIIKHANPCGVATAATLADAYRAARACDPVSAFGGIIALNQPIDGPTASAITELFTEVIIAPEADAQARAIIAGKPNLRLLICPLPNPARPGLAIKSISGGMLVQARDALLMDDLTIVTKRQPTDAELADMHFAWTVAKHVKSNAIVYAKGGATAGIGAGQMSRLDSARIAAWKARDAADTAGWSAPRTVGSAVASDAFFPFADGLIAAADAGATAIIQPGGSMRDAEVIAEADARGLTMAFTGLRHFAH